MNAQVSQTVGVKNLNNSMKNTRKRVKVESQLRLKHFGARLLTAR